MTLTAHLLQMHAAARDVATLHGEITDEWSRMAKRAKDLFGIIWAGIAAESYGEPWAECCDGVDRILDSLDSMGRMLTSAAQTYAQTDTSNAEQINAPGPYSPLRLP